MSQFTDQPTLQNTPISLVVSTGRTGTQFFAYMLDELAPDCLAVHEPNPDGFILATQRIREAFSDDEVIKRFNKMRAPLFGELVAGPKTLYMESNNNLVPFLSALLSNYPHARVLHVVREPISYVASALNNVQNSTYTLHGDTDPRKRVCADDFPNDPYYGRWQNLSQIERLAWHWQAYNKMIKQQAESHPHYLCLSFERLFASGDPKPMQAALEFMTGREFSLDELSTVLLNKQNHRERPGQPQQSRCLTQHEQDAIYAVIERCKDAHYLAGNLPRPV